MLSSLIREKKKKNQKLAIVFPYKIPKLKKGITLIKLTLFFSKLITRSTTQPE